MRATEYRASRSSDLLRSLDSISCLYMAISIVVRRTFSSKGLVM